MLKFSGRNESHGKKAEDSEADKALSHRLPKFGVALFDESRNSGWAMLPDGEPFRFRMPEDLSNDCIWVCSSEGNDFRDRWGKLHHIRPSDYISKLSYLGEDFGLRIAGPGKYGILAQEACRVLAPTIHCAMVIAAQVYGWRHPAQMLRWESLADDLRRHLWALVKPPAIQSHMRGPLAAAFQYYSSPVVSSGYSATRVRVHLRYNRLTHARRVMATPIPDGNWTYESAELSHDFKVSAQEALDPEVPCLVNATVEFGGQEQEIAALCAFGAMPGRQVLRNWISQPELRWLSRHAHVQITGIMRSAGLRPMPRQLELPAILTGDPFFELSVSAGMVAEAHWRALVLDVFKPSVEGKKDISIWAVWLRAADRALCFELALAAHKAGFLVTGYGNGGAMVECERDALPSLLDFTVANDVAHPAFRPIFVEHGLVKNDQ